MSIATKLRTLFRGDVSFATLVREAFRRRRMSAKRGAERRLLWERGAMPARLCPEFAKLSPPDLLEHFRSRDDGFFAEGDIAASANELFPHEKAKLIADADLIVDGSKWPLAGFGPLEFTGDNYWRRDPLGTKDWGLDYHADIYVFSNHGADIRVLWELNRFGHAVTLARAYSLTKDERYAETFFAQVEDWFSQNPYGRGANWLCAMEVALRAINLLAAFDLVRGSAACTERRLLLILQLFDQHGRFTLDNNEFSYLATSNHYLSDIVGLFWIGTFLPELEHASEWRSLGLSETLREIHKQVQPDGSDFEASTAYHKFVAEMLLYTFLLAKSNGIAIAHEHWEKLRTMFDYLHGIMRPDGRMPLIGDADGSQIVPVVKRDSDDASYLLALAAVVFSEPKFKEFAEITPEVLLLLGPESVEKFMAMTPPAATGSIAFPDAGAYVLRGGDLYLHLNANDTGINGRGSHAHNDALSIEVSALGRAFIVDPGTYVYRLDEEERHHFRSTALHSTATVDAEEQNVTIVDLPFILGNEAIPHVLEWQTSSGCDTVSAEHFGYARLPEPVTHRRTVKFDKGERYWTIVDEFNGKGKHIVSSMFHLAPGISVECGNRVVRLSDREGRTIYIQTTGVDAPFEIVASRVSRNYGHREDSSILRWAASVEVPWTVCTVIVPVSVDEDVAARLELLARVADNIGGPS